MHIGRELIKNWTKTTGRLIWISLNNLINEPLINKVPMRLPFILILFFTTGALKAQNSIDIARIDSVVGTISERAANNGFRVVEGLLDSDNMRSIRFCIDNDSTRLIVVESGSKENATLYYLNLGELIYAANFKDGNYNEIYKSYYFLRDFSYEKVGERFIKIDPEYFRTLIYAFFDKFKEQLK